LFFKIFTKQIITELQTMN